MHTGNFKFQNNNFKFQIMKEQLGYESYILKQLIQINLKNWTLIKSVTFFSAAWPFWETFLCALETLGLARSWLAFRLEVFFLVCMSTSRRMFDKLINFCRSNQSSKNRFRKTNLTQCIQEPLFKDPSQSETDTLVITKRLDPPQMEIP